MFCTRSRAPTYSNAAVVVELLSSHNSASEIEVSDPSPSWMTWEKGACSKGKDGLPIVRYITGVKERSTVVRNQPQGVARETAPQKARQVVQKGQYGELETFMLKLYGRGVAPTCGTRRVQPHPRPSTTSRGGGGQRGARVIYGCRCGRGSRQSDSRVRP